jgi:hypothetical protein
VSVLWSNNNGMVACGQHLGFAATAALQAKPKARKLETSLDTWRRLPKSERSEPWGACEKCGVRMEALQ